MLTVRKNQMQSMAASNPGTKNIQPCENTRTWVEVQLLDEEDVPVGGVKYKIMLPDSSIMEGTLDANGSVRFDDIIPGTCMVNFPEIDLKEWRAA